MMTMEEDSVAVISSEDRERTNPRNVSIYAFTNGMPDNTASAHTDDRSLALTLARRVIDSSAPIMAISTGDAATLLALLSKWHREETFKKAATLVSKRLQIDDTLRNSLSIFELTDCLASLARWDQDEEVFKTTGLALIRRFALEGASVGYLNGQAVANCFSAL